MSATSFYKMIFNVEIRRKSIIQIKTILNNCTFTNHFLTQLGRKYSWFKHTKGVIYPWLRGIGMSWGE